MAKSKKANSNLITSLLYIVVGVLLVAFRDQALEWAMTIAGAVFVLFGILELVKKNYVGGAVSLVIGIVIIVLGWKLSWLVLLVLGILVAIKGVIALVAALGRSRKSGMEIFFAALTITVGVLLALGNGVGLIILVGGILLIVDGIIGLVGYLKKH